MRYRLSNARIFLKYFAFGFVVLIVVLVKTQYYVYSSALPLVDLWGPSDGQPTDLEANEITYLESTENPPTDMNIAEERNLSREKLVLFWTTYYRSPDFYKGSDRNPFRTCPVRNCKTTNDRSLLNMSDAVVFHPFDISLKDKPPYRLPHQRWVWFNLESPIYTTNWRNDTTVYDWTMTFHSDSDIYHPYGKVVPFKEKPLITSVGQLPKTKIWSSDLSQFRYMKEASSFDDTDVRFDLDSFVKAKTKGIAWVVSHCVTHSNRHLYVSELAKYIDIDIYGKCGSLSCGRKDNCLQRIGTDYKFYLAFENSVCVEYVTEKFFNSLRNGIVPIVFGVKAHYKIAPPNSFIDARQFESPKALAEFMSVVLKNDTLYKQYLLWNEDFKLNFNGGWCDLCKALNDPILLGRKPAHPNVNQWWFTENPCVRPIR